MINKTLLVATATFVLFAGLATHNAFAQNATTNVTNTMKNITSTASEMGQNASNAMGNASATANQTISEARKNATDTGQNMLNQAVEDGKKIGSEAADVVKQKYQKKEK